MGTGASGLSTHLPHRHLPTFESFNTLLSFFFFRTLQICCLIAVANVAKHYSDECVSHNMMVCIKINVLKIELANVKHPE